MISRLVKFQLRRSEALPNFWHAVSPQWRAFSSSTSGGSDDDDKKKRNKVDHINENEEEEEEEDMFGMDDFLTVDSSEEDREAALKAQLERELAEMQKKGEEITPEIASDVVSRMVDATTQSIRHEKDGIQHHVHDLLSAITPHTISVLRASRLTTNSVVASSFDCENVQEEYKMYPISRRVLGHLYVPYLNLSIPATEALRILAGPRVILYGEEEKKNKRITGFNILDNKKDPWIEEEEEEMEREQLAMEGKFTVKVGCDKFPTREENKAFIISRFDHLVREAKLSVGESVDERLLRKWEDVMKEVERQATDEIEEAGGVQNVVGPM